MASLTFQNFIFFPGVWMPPDPISFKCCIHISEIPECLERQMSGSQACRDSTHGPIEKEIRHLKAEKNKLNHSGCLLSQILFHCFVCLGYMYFLFILLPLFVLIYVCSNPILIIFSVDGHHLAFYRTEHNYSNLLQSGSTKNASLARYLRH